MAEAAQHIIPITTPNRSFECHNDTVTAIAVFPDGRKMVTSSSDETIFLWDLKDGVVLKKMEGHRNRVRAVAVSINGQLIASGDDHGKLIVWHGDTGEYLIQVNQAHSNRIMSLDFSPDGTVLTTGSWDKTTKLWSTKTYQVDGNPISCGSEVYCVRYSPSGELAVATLEDIKIWNSNFKFDKSESMAKLKVKDTFSLAWTSDGTRLLSVHFYEILEWDTSTWQQIRVGRWTGHGYGITAFAINSTGTLVASAFYNSHVRLYRRSDKKTIAIFKHSAGQLYLAFSTDGTHFFSGGYDNKISQWAVPDDALLQDTPESLISPKDTLPENHSGEQPTFKAVPIRYITRHLLTTAEELENDVDGNTHNSYVNRSLLIARNRDSDNALHYVANQKWCDALLRAGRPAEAQEAYCHMMGMNDETTTVDCRHRSLAFEQECWALCTRNGDSALSSKDYDKAIELYSAAIALDSASDTIFASRCKAEVGKMLWEDALLDAQKAIELNPSSYVGYELMSAALHGAQRYDEVDLDIMLSKLNHVSDTHTRELPPQYMTSSEAASAIQEVIDAQLEDAPHRLINTITGRLYNHKEQAIAFKTSPEYHKLVLSTMKHTNADFRKEIKKSVEMYFRSVMLSHRWQDYEPLLSDIQDKDIYKLNPVGGIMKLQSFCQTARDVDYLWAWVDTCCIDQTNNAEVQESVNSMFVWYRLSALTIVYLSDVPPSSKSGALARSVWNQRGWTVQEFLAPKIVLFYQSDWTLYLNDHSPNHKDSPVIMRELADATGIDPQTLVAFRPGMKDAREKLQWVSRRITTRQEDIAYSLFGIFGIHLPVLYGEKRQYALGRLLQDVIAQSGDISCLDWAGKPSEFNSCLPADITSYRAPPSARWSPLSQDAMQKSISSLRYNVDAKLTSKLYQTLSWPSAPQFVARRLHLRCIAFTVTSVKRMRGGDRQTASTYVVKADGLRDLSITTEDKLIPFSGIRPIRQAILLVRPWDDSLLELPDHADLPDLSDSESEEYLSESSPPASPLHELPVQSLGANSPVDSHSRELRLIAHLGEPFSAFLLAQQRGGEYKRIASDRNITARVQEMTAVRDMMDVRTLEIL